jgi:hypothetical protein
MTSRILAARFEQGAVSLHALDSLKRPLEETG